MKATIYALVDPNTHQVRYVGRTNKSARERFAMHMGAARRGEQKAVYNWIRSLSPAQPLLVILRDGIDSTVKHKTKGRWLSTSQWEETKWMKRLEHSPLLCEIARDSAPYISLVNPTNMKAVKKGRS